MVVSISRMVKRLKFNGIISVITSVRVSLTNLKSWTTRKISHNSTNNLSNNRANNQIRLIRIGAATIILKGHNKDPLWGRILRCITPGMGLSLDLNQENDLRFYEAEWYSEFHNNNSV